MTVIPSFYEAFCCKAGECSDSCCIGWEIDIDEFSLEKYNNIVGHFGDKLRKAIGADGECYFFKLSEDERCPFLNSDGLCDIFINLGEDNLCDICTEHPRFYNEIGDIAEAGLGLCCEKVCEMLFDENYDLKFVSDGDCNELSANGQRMLEVRSQIFDIIMSDDKNLFEKMNDILNLSSSIEGRENTFFFSFDYKLIDMVLKIFLKTEPINTEWTKYIENLYSDREKLHMIAFDKDYDKLLMYLFYRHFCNVVYDDEYYLWALFCCVNVFFIYLCDSNTFCLSGKYTFNDRILNVKRWSKQIEYSTDNIEVIKSIV